MRRVQRQRAFGRPGVFGLSAIRGAGRCAIELPKFLSIADALFRARPHSLPLHILWIVGYHAAIDPGASGLGTTRRCLSLRAIFLEKQCGDKFIPMQPHANVEFDWRRVTGYGPKTN